MRLFNRKHLWLVIVWKGDEKPDSRLSHYGNIPKQWRGLINWWATTVGAGSALYCTYVFEWKDSMFVMDKHEISRIYVEKERQ